MSKHKLSCDPLTLHLFHDHQLSPQETSDFMEHLASCPHCTSKLINYEMMTAAYQEVKLPEDFASSILENLPPQEEKSSSHRRLSYAALVACALFSFGLVQGSQPTPSQDLGRALQGEMHDTSSLPETIETPPMAESASDEEPLLGASPYQIQSLPTDLPIYTTTEASIENPDFAPVLEHLDPLPVAVLLLDQYPEEEHFQIPEFESFTVTNLLPDFAYTVLSHQEALSLSALFTDPIEGQTEDLYLLLLPLT